MIKRILLSAAAAALFVAAFAINPAAAYWAGAPAAATQTSQADLSGATNVHWRWHGGYPWYWGPPRVYGYPYHFYRPHHPRRCGWVWSPRLYRHVWRCW
jgi:hypothetical protein